VFEGNRRRIISISVVMIVLGLVFTLGKSYAYFETSIVGSNITLGVGKLTHSLNSDVKLQAGESRIIDLIVKSNDDVRSKYQLFYKSDNDLTNVSVGYSSNSTDLPSGEIEAKGRKNISIILINNSSNAVSLEIGVRGGLNKNTVEDIILEDGEYRVEAVINKDVEQIKTSSELYAFYKGSFAVTATSSEVLSGKTVYLNGVETTGTMTDNGAVSKTITPSSSTQTYTIPKGYHNGSGKVTVSAVSSGTSILKGKTIVISAGTHYLSVYGVNSIYLEDRIGKAIYVYAYNESTSAWDYLGFQQYQGSGSVSTYDVSKYNILQLQESSSGAHTLKYVS